MVSVSSNEVVKKNLMLWITTKTITVILLATFFYFFSSRSVQFAETSLPNQTTNLMLKEEFTFSNKTGPECNLHNITLENRCYYVQNNEECPKYLNLYYCHFQGAVLIPVYYVMMFIWIYLLFYLLGDTAQSYFVPSLIRISEYLKLSPNVAGVTLMALGNGINDIASMLIGVLFSGSTGFAVGGTIGSCLFITTFVLGLVLILSKVEVGRYPFFRDITFFFISVGLAFYFFLMNRVMVYESIICLFVYFFYVLVVILGPVFRKLINLIVEKVKSKIKKPETDPSNNLEETLLDKDIVEELEEDDWTGGWKSFPKFVHHVHHTPIEEKTLSHKESVINPPLQKELLVDEISSESLVNTDYFTKAEEGEESEKDPNFFFRMWDKLMATSGWSDKPWYSKITFVVYEWIFIFVRNITCFRADENDWNRWFAVAVPIFAPFWIFTALNPYYVIYLIGGVFPLIIIFVLIGICLSMAILLTTRGNRAPIYQPLLVILAFPLSSFWIYWGAKELIDVLRSFGYIWGISDAILAVTILSWGNSIGDAVSDVVVARQGQSKMAIGAIFGGPLLNILLGCGIAFTFNQSSLKTGCFSLPGDGNVSISFIFLIGTLFTSFIFVPMNNNIVGKIYGVFLILVYFVYVGISVLVIALPTFGNVFTWNFGIGCQ